MTSTKTYIKIFLALNVGFATNLYAQSGELNIKKTLKLILY